MSNQEVFGLIMHPGFSTKNTVNEFSGRGVGMNVIAESIRAINGTVAIDSTPGRGTTITLKTPLALTIIDGMGS